MIFIVNKLAKVNQLIHNSPKKMPEMLTFKSFKSKLTQNFDKMKINSKNKVKLFSNEKKT